MLKIVLRIIGILGFIVILGTAGASDCGSIDGMRILWQNAVGVIMVLAGLFSLGESQTGGWNLKC